MKRCFGALYGGGGLSKGAMISIHIIHRKMSRCDLKITIISIQNKSFSSYNVVNWDKKQIYGIKKPQATIEHKLPSEKLRTRSPGNVQLLLII